MSDRGRSYEEAFDAQLQEWCAQIALLQVKAGNAGAGARIEYHAVIDALQEKQTAAGKMLSELKTTAAQAWDDLKKQALKMSGLICNSSSTGTR